MNMDRPARTATFGSRDRDGELPLFRRQMPDLPPGTGHSVENLGIRGHRLILTHCCWSRTSAMRLPIQGGAARTVCAGNIFPLGLPRCDYDFYRASAYEAAR